jgi:release factor glutamine methyltransferase
MRCSPRTGRLGWPQSRAKARVTDTLRSILTEAAGVLKAADCDKPWRRARQLAAGVLGLGPIELVMSPERMLCRPEAARLLAFARRMANGEPLSRVLGRREFWGLEFALSPETLDPRPESETLVEAVLARLPDRAAPQSVLDLGTGTGCLLLALLSELPMASGIGVDLSEEAVATARQNAQALGFADRAHFVVGDWGAALARRFDVIAANPPYVETAALRGLPREVSRYDPLRALDGGEDGLAAYRRIAPQLPALLAPSGLFVAEVGAGQSAAVAAVLQKRGLVIDAIERDLAGIERCVVARGNPVSARPAVSKEAGGREQ